MEEMWDVRTRFGLIFLTSQKSGFDRHQHISKSTSGRLGWGPSPISPGAGPLQGEQRHIPGAGRRGSKRRSAGMGMALDQIIFPGVFVNHVISDKDQSAFSKLGVLQMQYLFNQLSFLCLQAPY